MDKLSPPNLSPQDVLLQDAGPLPEDRTGSLPCQNAGGLNNIRLRSGFFLSRRVRPL